MHTNNSTQHTSTPWRTNGATITAYGAWGLTIASCRSRQDPVNAHPGLAAKTTDEAKANAAFIARAVNAHDELVAALEGTIDCLTAHELDCARDGLKNASSAARDALSAVRAALAKL